MKYLILILTAFFVNSISAQKLYYDNPILAGFYPDPSICKAGNDYYLVNSSFSYFPGLPIFHSRDLVNWKQIGHAMDRAGQLNLDGAGVSRGLFAPAISYHNGRFYIVCTLIDKLGNFIITATDPGGRWSDPVPLPEVNGIDPSLYFEEDGSAYILYNSISPNNQPLYDGHRTIRMYAFDAVNLKVKGEEKLLINGGTDITKKPVWIEGPHILKKDGWYYLLCAEGGTGYNHSEVVFRSRDINGPYISYENNPILTQRHLDPARTNPITTTGHADLIEANDGKWWAVFLGCRPYEGEHFNTGRETFMVPVTWKNGWPHILEGKEEVKYRYPVPMQSLTKSINNNFSGNPVFRDEFNLSHLDHRWMFLRTPSENWYSLTEKKGSLVMRLRQETCSGRNNPSLIAHRQQNINCIVSTSFQFEPVAVGEKAGLLVFQNETHFFYLCKTMENDKMFVRLYKSTMDSTLELLASAPLTNKKNRLDLRIEARGANYSFYYTENGGLKLLKDSVDGRFLSTKTAGGFVGTVFGLYVESGGQASKNKATFQWFEYRGNDPLYKKR